MASTPPKEKVDLRASPSRTITNTELQERFARDARFNVPPPSKWKRFALLVFVVFLFWIALRMRPKQPQVIYAERYSRQYKFRPAASPIITERLKDGRIRIRGAHVPTDRGL